MRGRGEQGKQFWHLLEMSNHSTKVRSGTILIVGLHDEIKLLEDTCD